jgi:hypothetical protein
MYIYTSVYERICMPRSASVHVHTQEHTHTNTFNLQEHNLSKKQSEAGGELSPIYTTLQNRMN